MGVRFFRDDEVQSNRAPSVSSRHACLEWLGFSLPGNRHRESPTCVDQHRIGKWPTSWWIRCTNSKEVRLNGSSTNIQFNLKSACQNGIIPLYLLNT